MSFVQLPSNKKGKFNISESLVILYFYYTKVQSMQIFAWWTYVRYTWSAHQYHMETNVERTKTPGHGRSEVKGSLRIWKASSRGSPQELLKYVMLCTYVALESAIPYCFGTASKYLTIRPSMPPTFTNPTNDNDPCNARRIVLRWEELVWVQVSLTHYCQDNRTSQHYDGL